MGVSEKAALKRLGRGTVGLLLSGASWFVTKNPATLVFAPLINMIGKWLRTKYNIKNVPF